MTELAQKNRIESKLREIEQAHGKAIHALLEQLNQTRLQGKGTAAILPRVEKNTLRWSLKWKTDSKVSLEIAVAVGVEDDGQSAQIAGVWVHRHASAPMEFEGHTPTTTMNRLGLQISIPEIREAIDSQWR